MMKKLTDLPWESRFVETFPGDPETRNFFLGVPTTRALSLVSTGDIVIRDMFYDGNPGPEPGAVVCRVAPSFLRFGNFQIHAAYDETEILRRLFDFVSVNYFSNKKDWFLELCRRTALLMTDWMR